MLTQEKVDKIEAILPHGSGINYDYEIRVTGSRLYVSNGYDVYDEYGLFVSDLPFTVCYKLNA